jgi:AcrR family transcriptional regulator
VPRISKEREAAVRRRIFDAAISVFERHGFARASMSAIATQAGLSSGAIYTYFGSKEELFLSAFGSLVEEQEAALTEAIADSRATSEAIDLAVEYMAHVAAGGGDFRGAGANFLLHAWATAEENESLRAMLLRRREHASALARAIIDDAVSRGELASDLDADGLALAITSLLDGLFLQRAERGHDFSVDDARRQAHAVIDAIFRPSPTTLQAKRARTRKDRR